jgi:hypothetical protein
VSWYACCFILGLIPCLISTSYLFYFYPNRYHFIHSLLEFGDDEPTWVWTLFWIFEMLQQYIFWGLAAYTGISVRIFGRIAIHGMKMLR